MMRTELFSPPHVKQLSLVIEADAAVTLSKDVVANAFDAQRLLQHRARFIDALTWAK